MRAGFTLVEVLLAMVITSILVLGINGIYRQAHVLWARIEDQRPAYRAANEVIACLRAEMLCLYTPPVDQNDVAFLLATEPDGSSELRFYTLCPAWRGNSAFARSARVCYRFRKGESGDDNVLERIEEFCAGERTVGNALQDVLLTGRCDLKLWALDRDADASDRSIRPSYESRDRPPKALKVVLQVSTNDETPALRFETLIEIPCDAQIQGDSSEQAASLGRIAPMAMAGLLPHSLREWPFCGQVYDD